MPTDTQAILDAADKIGQMVKDHPAYERYRSAAKAVGEDPEAGRLVSDFNRQLETLMRQEHRRWLCWVIRWRRTSLVQEE